MTDLDPFESLKRAKTITAPFKRVEATCKLIRMKEREYPARIDTDSEKLGGDEK